jgi:alpha-ketoglutarate-dependent taurine dioxygenase
VTEFRSEPIQPHIGEIVHADRAALLDEAVARRCLDLLEARGVLVFPQLGLTAGEQLAFTDRLGARVRRARREGAGGPVVDDVYRVTFESEFNSRPEYVLGTWFWHMDDLTSDYPPPRATLLTARRLSPTGGQTEFTSTYVAYETLPTADKAAIEGLKAVHSLSASLSGVFDYQSAEERARLDGLAVVKEHPLVWTHASGRKSLVVGTTTDRIARRPLAEGRALLARLLEWTVQPQFVYRHEWREGDLVIWDNCGTLHRVLPYDRASGRLMHRTTIAGVETVQ